jgi:DnaK suppressor protein
MKSLLTPWIGDLADAGRTDSRKERDEALDPARPDVRDTVHPHSEWNETETLASIERALHRLTSGTYGVCVSCGSDIELARLEDNPAIDTCGTCDGKSSFKAH